MTAYRKTEVESLNAGSDLSTSQFRFVKLQSNGRVIRCDTAGERAYGVVLNKPTEGKTAQVAIGTGGSEVTAGGAVNRGVEVTTDNQGRAVAATTDKHYVNGIARTSAAAAGNRFGVNLTTYQKNV